jgi:hypothetical protein
LTPEKKEEEIATTLIETGFTNDEATVIAKAIAVSEIKYHFESSAFEGSAFFSVKPAGGKIIINLNTKHPAYSNLLEVLDQDDNNEHEIDKLQDRLIRTKRFKTIVDGLG